MSEASGTGAETAAARSTTRPPEGYRPCVGAMIVNASGLVWIGRRNDDLPDGLDGRPWQMPQGGIDKGEAPEDAVLREVFEETNIASVRMLAASSGWLSYDLPPAALKKRWRNKYRGQAQRWFLLAFEGRESEIDVHRPGGGTHDPEFDAWKWVEPSALPGLIVPFKRPVYVAALAEFRPAIEAQRAGG